MAIRKRNKHNPNYLKYLIISNLFNCFGMAVFAPLYAIYVLELGAKPATGSYIWAAYMLLTAVLILLFGKFENRIQNKLKAICIGNVLQLIGAVIILAFPSIGGLLLGLLVYGGGTGILSPSWYCIYSNHLYRKKGAEEWSWSISGVNFAIAAGAGVGGIIITQHSFQVVLAFMVASSFMGLVSVFKLYRTDSV